MKKSLFILFCLLFAAVSTEVFAAKKVTLKTEMDKVSYGIGLSIGRNFSQQKLSIEMEPLMQGIKDALANKKPMMSEEEIKKTMTDFRKKMMAKYEKEQKAVGDKNKKDGEAFLKKNKKRKGVKTTKSGLQYEVIKKGKGKKPSAEDIVVVDYKGTLIDGTEFDSSHKRGKPATFPVKGVIPGWQEALKLMSAGSKWKVYVPAELAYGPRGTGRMIGPNSTLIFEVELKEIKAKK